MNAISKTFKPNRRKYSLLGALLFTVISFSVSKPVLTDRDPDEAIYLVIKSEISQDLLESIAKRLKSKHINLTYHELTFRNGQLKAIDMTITVSTPGKPTTSYHLQETDSSGIFQPLVFYYRPGGDQVGFVKGTSTELTPDEQQLLNQKLRLLGLLIKRPNGREILGSWHSD